MMEQERMPKTMEHIENSQVNDTPTSKYDPCIYKELFSWI
jgi:hypothetical protein